MELISQAPNVERGLHAMGEQEVAKQYINAVIRGILKTSCIGTAMAAASASFVIVGL
ncbi:hypothetical protein [Sorangium sp. So ce513]|uniref:hypothetical protein n=1 Tax=Sorangium sp. So ce513 TaxID=3133315 RepID=UPI003F5DED6C